MTARLLTTERRAITGLAGLYATRMLGLFMVLPVLALYAKDLSGATPLLVGVALGAYGRALQALLESGGQRLGAAQPPLVKAAERG